MSAAAPRFAARDDHRLHFEVQGSGPPLVLLPGLGSGMRLFGTLPRRLAREGLCAITYDPVGIPPSSALAGQFVFGDAARDVLAVVDAVGCKTVDLVGTSLGGKVALTLATLAPERIRRIVLLASSAVVTPRARRVYRYFETVAETVPAERLLEVLAPFLFGRTFHDRHPQVVDDIVRASRPPAATRELMIAQARALLDFELGTASIAATITAPVLCIAGNEDALTPPEEVAATASSLPNGRYLEIPGAGHSLLLEQPATLTATLDFLRADSPTA